MDQILEKLKNKQDLTFEESKTAFEILMSGKAGDDEIFEFLTLLSEKGEISDEIAGGVFVLREKSKRVNVSDCIDTCGTGGDGMNTLNISTASALLLASMGTKVAKHGNKAVSSKCGSGDVLEALKIKIDLEPEDIEKEINTNNFGFMFAPNYYSAMKFVGNVRKKIGILKNLPKTFEATRYHSLIIDKKTLSKELEITAETEDGTIMGVQHKKFNIHGVQFHPESIKTKLGIEILKNFINYR